MWWISMLPSRVSSCRRSDLEAAQLTRRQIPCCPDRGPGDECCGAGQNCCGTGCCEQGNPCCGENCCILGASCSRSTDDRQNPTCVDPDIKEPVEFDANEYPEVSYLRSLPRTLLNDG